MTIFNLTASLCYILHTLGAELVGLGIRCRLMIAALVLSREHLLIVANDVILQFAHRLILHTRHFAEGLRSLVERVLG